MTPEELAVIRERAEAGNPGGTEPEPWGGVSQMAQDIAVLLAALDEQKAKIARLRLAYLRASGLTEEQIDEINYRAASTPKPEPG